MKKENKKRLIGLLTSPITGNLSEEVKEEIFGWQHEYSCFELGIYGDHWTGKLATGISIFSNIAVPLTAGVILHKFGHTSSSLISFGVGAYNMFEGFYRSLNGQIGSLVGNLISNYFIEPKLPKDEEDKQEINKRPKTKLSYKVFIPFSRFDKKANIEWEKRQNNIYCTGKMVKGLSEGLIALPIALYLGVSLFTGSLDYTNWSNLLDKRIKKNEIKLKKESIDLFNKYDLNSDDNLSYEEFHKYYKNRNRIDDN